MRNPHAPGLQRLNPSPEQKKASCARMQELQERAPLQVLTRPH